MRFYNPVNQDFFNEFFFVQDQNSQAICFSSKSLELEYPEGPGLSQKPLTIPLNKTIKNSFNIFYVEIENLSQEWFAFGYADGRLQAAQPIGQALQVTNFAIEYKMNRIQLYVDKQLKLEKTVSDPQRVGLGLFALTGKLFVTVDGVLVKEVKCPRISEEGESFTGHISLKQKSHIKAVFKEWMFDLDAYVGQKIGSVQEESGGKKVKQKDVLFLVKSYLNENGFGKTLNSLDSQFREKQKEKKEKDGNFQSSLNQDLKDSIRENVIQNKDWNFVLENLELDKSMIPQIQFLLFIDLYFQAQTSQEKLTLFERFSALFKENREMKILSTEMILEQAASDFILEQNLQKYQDLQKMGHRNNILGECFDSHKNNELSRVLAHLQVLAELQSSFYGFSKGFSLDNLNH